MSFLQILPCQCTLERKKYLLYRHETVTGVHLEEIRQDPLPFHIKLDVEMNTDKKTVQVNMKIINILHNLRATNCTSGDFSLDK